MAYARPNRSPAFLASALFHAAMAAIAIVGLPWFTKPMQIGKVVPVTIITNGPPAELAPAEEAPQPQEALAPAPEPQAPPEPAPLSSAPPKPEPTPALAKNNTPPPKPSQAKPSQANQQFDLADLANRLKQERERASTRATSGQIGPNQQRAAAAASDSKGQDDSLSANELNALGEKVGKLWNPNCQVEGAATYTLRVRVKLTPQGFLAANPELMDRDRIMSSGDQVLIAAAQRALSAVGRGQPYTDVLRPEHYAQWRETIWKFNPKDTCRLLSAARSGD